MSDICHLTDNNTKSICGEDGWTDDHMFLSDYWSGGRICSQEVCTKCLELEPVYALSNEDV